MHQRAKQRCKFSGREFDLQVSDIVIPDVCPILGIPLNMNSGKSGAYKNSPSLDRIDNNKGYIKDNIHVISQLANAMKGGASNEELHKFADWIKANVPSTKQRLVLNTLNLSEVVVRSEDTPDTLAKKVRIATIIGTFQSTLTDFRYIRKQWKRNAEDERLLGVSLTGIMDSNLTNGVEAGTLLQELRLYAIQVNKEWADKLGINPSVAITTVNLSSFVE